MIRLMQFTTCYQTKKTSLDVDFLYILFSYELQSDLNSCSLLTSPVRVSLGFCFAPGSDSKKNYLDALKQQKSLPNISKL